MEFPNQQPAEAETSKRVLYVCQGWKTHASLMKGAMDEARAAGHVVALATAPSLEEQVAGYGFEYLKAGEDWSGAQADAMAEEAPPRELRNFAAAQPLFFQYMAGEPTVGMARDVMAIAESWNPDLIVGDPMTFGAALATEALGRPYVNFGLLGFTPEAFSRRWLKENLAASRATLGLRPQPKDEPAYQFYAALVPEQFDPRLKRLGNVHFYQDEARAKGEEPVPDWLVSAAASGERPVIYGSLSSVALAYAGLSRFITPLMKAMITALSDFDCEALISTGGWLKREELGSLPNHVHVEDFVPQRAVLKYVDLFITHGGFGSVRETIAAGKPMLVIPSLVGDHRYNGRRAINGGMAMEILPDELTPKKLIRACDSMISDDRFKKGAEEMQRHMLALPGQKALIGDMVQYANKYSSAA